MPLHCGQWAAPLALVYQLCTLFSDGCLGQRKKQSYQRWWPGDCSGGPVVRPPRFHCRSPGSIPGQGTRMPQTAGLKRKKKKKNVAWAIRLSSQENHWISHLGITGACLAMPIKTKSPVNGCCRNEWINDLTSGQVGAWPQVAPVVKNPPVSAGFHSWVKKIPWRKAWQPTPVFLPDKSHEQRSLEGYSPWDHKELDQLSTHTCWASCPICKQE